jgi:two-component system copper resistance phosphate regulon response regulator CusR
MNVLLIEDEKSLGLAIVRILKQAGHALTWATDGANGYAEAKHTEYDVLVLDILLPGKNGWDICADLRRAKVNTPILMLTAMDEVGDRVKGLNLGADDYLPKPFDANELAARVNALGRRDKVNRGSSIRIADLEIDRDRRSVIRGGDEIHLTRREYDLLEALAVNEGRVLSREVIQSRVWGDEEGFSNTVDVFIGTLRKKLDAPFERKLIHTVVGFGYVLKQDDA